MQEDFDPNKSELSESIIKVLCYFDIFNYPLKSEEILYFLCTSHVIQKDVDTQLGELKMRKRIYQLEIFYSTKDDASLVERRKKGNIEAQKFLTKAIAQANLIHSFPFIKSVMTSGSLSKGYMDEKCDLDFFLITESGRVWIARTLLAIYKRIFLLNSHKYFCLNYYIDEDHLTIDEKNLFTATELATLIPLKGTNYYQQLMIKNNWVKHFLPNFKPKPFLEDVRQNKGVLSILVEKILRYPIGDRIESYCMRISHHRSERLYQSQYSKEDFEIAFKTNKSTSKNHPKNYQQKVRELYEAKLKTFPINLKSNWNYGE